MENKSHNPQEYYQAYASDPTMKNQVEPAPFGELFRFADTLDKVVMFFGSLCALGVGTVLILYAQPLGKLVDAFADNKNDVNLMVDVALEAVKLFGINSLGVLVGSWLMSAAWTITSERQMIVARKAYLDSLLQQEVAWHDRNRPAELCSKMYLQIQKVHKALVNNMTSIITKISMGISGVVLALVTGW
jgi:ATP-binding cassette subfamily B (MDR/TAP) protein 1